MGNAIAIFDIPKDCNNCPCSYFVGEDVTGHCQLSKEIIPHADKILDSCPLLKLPESRPCNYFQFENYNNGYDKGWNDFRDTIMLEGTVKGAEHIK